MGKLIRGLVAVAVAMTAATGLAAPAAADDDAAPEGTLEGVFTYTQGNTTATWRIYPLCVPTVGDGRCRCTWRSAANCRSRATVRRGRPEPTGCPTDSGPTRRPSWRRRCSDGTTAASEEMYQFDTSLRGTYTHSHSAVCGLQPGLEKHPFTLTFVSPLPNPVIHYPLTCQDNPIHLCS